MANEWGPLAGLIGDWEGEGGLDTAYSHAHRDVIGTPYREKCSMTPFGPVDNGPQKLYGLDYRSAMWRGDEQSPFHTEVGYWLWDGAAGEVVRGFVVPRGIAVLAGGTTSPDAGDFVLRATNGGAPYAIGENRYLPQNASTASYEVRIIVGEGTWSYDEVAMLHMAGFEEPFAHRDHNTLRRVG